MAKKSKARVIAQGEATGKVKRPPAKRQQAETPWLAIAVGSLLTLAFAALLVWSVVINRPTGGGGSGQSAFQQGSPIHNIQCEGNEQVAVHYHAHLDMYYLGNPVALQAQAGINRQRQCLYWLHTHDASGIVHIEAPAGFKDRVFTLGDFFAIWGEPLDAQHMGTLNVPAGDNLKAYVNGQAWTGAPGDIPLKAHEEIVLVIGPPEPLPVPATYNWPPGV